MNITSAKYYTEFDGTDNIGIKLKIGDETVFVPLDPDNRHYQAIQEWVAEGNTIQEAD
jgi:translation initiation factor 6 (eIF-6)